MTSAPKKPTTIAAYIAAAPKEARPKLRQMAAAIRAAAPGATEAIKWGMPSFSYGRILVIFAGHTHHVGFYPTPSAVKAFAKELAKYHTAKGSVQFPYEKPLPLGLIRKMTAFRVKESREADRKWRTKR